MKIISKDVTIHYDLDMTPRQQQIDGVNFLKESIRSGNRYMLLNLPTGVGKSYLSVMFINWYLNYINTNAKFDILTNSKVLQKQYVKDFPYIRNLEGRANYTCERYATNCEDGMDICRANKSGCSLCPYTAALNNYVNSRVSITNFHMFNISRIYATAIKEGRNANVLIVDEAQDFESVFCDYLTTELNINSIIKCGFDSEELVMFRNIISSIDELEDFITKASDIIIPKLRNQINFINRQIAPDDEMPTSLTKDTLMKMNRQLRECNSKLSTIEIFLKEYESNPNNWILEVNHKIDKRSGDDIRTITVQPVWANGYIPKYALDSYDHIIFMSGTILDKKLFCNINGLAKEITTYYEIPSPFPVKNRMVYYVKLGKMTYKEKEDTYIRQLEFIKKTLDKYKNDKGIIHTFNYEISMWLDRDLTRSKYGNRLIFHETANRETKLDTHIYSTIPTVLVSPSMMSGVDLKDDLSRFQIILKMPYPNIKSKKIKKRQETYKDWYLWKTTVDLLQSYGRSVRSDEDFADTIILDSSLTDVMNQYGKFIPRYFTDAIKILKIR